MITTPSLELYFGNPAAPGLYRSVFRAPNHDTPTIGMRGPLFHAPSFPFIWSTSCIALSILFVSAVAHAARGERPVLPLLEGGPTSPAAAVGKLMNKGIRSWLHDIFGSDSAGRSLLTRILLLGNPRGRRQGPITATLRGTYLAPSNIKVFMDGEDISHAPDLLEDLRAKLIREFESRKEARLVKDSAKGRTTLTPCAA